MQTVSKAQKTARLKTAPKQARSAVAPQELIARLEKHVLVDGLKLLFDAEKSRGAQFVDATSGRGLIDFYSFYASQPIGFNHPYFDRPDVQADLLTAAKVNHPRSVQNNSRAKKQIPINNLVFSAALRQVNSADLASDIAQGVFIDLARKARLLAEQMPVGNSLAGWLHRSTRYAALNHWQIGRASCRERV